MDGATVGAIYTDWQGDPQITGLPVTAVAVCVDGGWYGYQPVCYANAPDYRSATLVTLTAGTIVSGIDVQLTDSASPTGRRRQPAQPNGQPGGLSRSSVVLFGGVGSAPAPPAPVSTR